MQQENVKERYLREIRARAGDNYIDPPQEDRIPLYAKILAATFKDKIGLTEEKWEEFLAEQGRKDFSIPNVTKPENTEPFLLVLLSGQASGKTALVTALKGKQVIDNNAVQFSTGSCLAHLLPDIENLNDKENAIATIRGEILYLQRLVTDIALANGLPTVLDIHVIEEEQAEYLANAARKREIPSMLISPHITMETYASRTLKRAREGERAPFKDEHFIFHQIFSENFEKHFKRVFDLSILLDNNQESTLENTALPVIYVAERQSEGKIQEKILLPEAYQNFKDKQNLKPYKIIEEVHQIKEKQNEPAQSDIQIKEYLTEVSAGLSAQRGGVAASATENGSRAAAEESATQRVGRFALASPLLQKMVEKSGFSFQR